ncbi:hypothetical protein CVT24_010116, partial [Panaeolus cyanescens]
KTSSNTAKKEKLFHPASRKAGQLARHAIRKGKMGNLVTKRHQKQNNLVDYYGFFFHAIPQEGVLSISEMHTIIRDVWLTRFDDELEEERAARRPGRPKSPKEVKLEEQKSREYQVYRTGMEVIDLTHQANVDLFRQWDQKEVPFIHLLRFIRIFGEEPEKFLVSRPGKHVTLVPSADSMDTDDTMMTT